MEIRKFPSEFKVGDRYRWLRSGRVRTITKIESSKSYVTFECKEDTVPRAFSKNYDLEFVVEVQA